LTPEYYASTILPTHLKITGTEKLIDLHRYMITNDWYQAMHVRDAINFTTQQDQWHEQKEQFLHHTHRRDKIRNEDFVKVFPELAGMING
jgi:hypothetical protein